MDSTQSSEGCSPGSTPGRGTKPYRAQFCQIPACGHRWWRLQEAVGGPRLVCRWHALKSTWGQAVRPVFFVWDMYYLYDDGLRAVEAEEAASWETQ